MVIIILVKGLFQWTLHVAQEKISNNGGGGGVIIAFFFNYGGDGSRFETI